MRSEYRKQLDSCSDGEDKIYFSDASNIIGAIEDEVNTIKDLLEDLSDKLY